MQQAISELESLGAVLEATLPPARSELVLIGRRTTSAQLAEAVGLLDALTTLLSPMARLAVRHLAVAAADYDGDETYYAEVASPARALMGTDCPPIGPHEALLRPLLAADCAGGTADARVGGRAGWCAPLPR